MSLRYAIAAVAIITLSLSSLTDSPAFNVQAQIHAGDRAALEALYDATDGDNWTNNTNWKSNVPLDQWFGVSTNEDGRVNGLYLPENNLNGTLPAEIGDLEELEDLGLASNSLSGTIPSEIGNLRNLNYLFLDDNELTGTIPSEIGNLRNLYQLWLNDNELTGMIPLELENLTGLTEDIHPADLDGGVNAKRLDVERNAGLCAPRSMEQWIRQNLHIFLLPTFCDELNSQFAQTYAIRDPGNDFNTLAAAGNGLPSGMWSDGTTMWVSDSNTDKLHAYKISDKSRDPDKDFDTLIAAGNRLPRGIWSDGTTMWVADSIGDKLYAYKMSDKSRDAGKDLQVSHAVGVDRAEGLWSDGTTMWVSDSQDDTLYAYSLSDNSRDPGKDFDTLSAAGIDHPRGIWSDGTTMWVLGGGEADTIYAYNMSDKSRDPGKDFETLVDAGNQEPWGIWSDGTTMWVTDWDDDKIYAYHASTSTSPASITRQFAQTYAPILRMHSAETVFPSAVEVMIQNAVLRDGEGDQVADHPTQLTSEYVGGFFFSVHEDHYLDLPSEAPYWLDDRTYSEYNAAQSLLNYGDFTDPTVYARVAVQDEVLALQYWFFYPLDRNHEGDWEMIQLEFDAEGTSSRNSSQVNELIANINEHGVAPTRLFYSSHISTNAECWQGSGSSKFEHEGFHPYVYPAYGSHANYFETGSHLVFPGLPLAEPRLRPIYDVTTGLGDALVPPTYSGQLSETQGYQLNLLESTTAGDDHWLNFTGKWGEQNGNFEGEGPPGPKFSSRWIDPAKFYDDVLNLDTRNCKDGKTLTSETGTQSIGNKQITINADDAEGEITLELSFDAVDAIDSESDLVVDIEPLSRVESLLPIFNLLENETRVGLGITPIGAQLYDIEFSETIGEEIEICIRIPYAQTTGLLSDIWHYDATNSKWEKLPTEIKLKFLTPFACATTSVFSIFALVNTNDFAATSRPKLASHIHPAITSITLSPSDTVRLSTNIFGQQDILDNSLSENLTFEWSLDGTVLEGEDHEIELKAPSTPGRYTLTASLSDTYCNAKHGSCSAEFNIRVRRPTSVDSPTDVSNPVNPAGQIPIVIPGADGTQHAVFTPVEGGSVKSGSCTFEAPSGAINDNEFIGIAVQTTDDPTQLTPVDDPRFVTQDSQCNLSAVDNAGTNVADYRLRVAGDVCIPLPDEYRSNALDVRLLSVNDSQTQILTSRVIVNDPEIPLKLCGKLSTLPNTVVAALPANLAPKIPTPEIVGDEVTTPDTGPSAIPPMAMWFILVLGIALLVFVTTVKLKNHNFRRSRR